MAHASCRRIASWIGVWLLAVALTASIGRGQDFGSSTSDTNVGYIDTAYVGNMVRFRADAAWGNDRPDRAEFFYAKCGCFQQFGDPNAPGPPLLESNVNYQTLWADAQILLTDRFSALVEIPVRIIQPEQNRDAGGMSDLQLGFKYALYAGPQRNVTFQLRSYIPTGDARLGLGTAHFSLEPALLWNHNIDQRWVFEWEFRDWIPIGASSSAGTGLEDQLSSFSGNILRYGLGIGYNLDFEFQKRLTPVVEFVGWTLLGGISDTLNGPIRNETGTTIFNVKVGARLTNACNGSLYAGYGFAITDQVWYTDVVRVEYRRMF
jgi:hypothetical protein